MKKSFIIIAAAATLFAACAGNDSYKEIDKQENNAISFNTYTSKLTRAENSNETELNNLEAYNTTFRLWGNKYINKGDKDANNNIKYDVTPIFGYDESANDKFPGEKVEFKATEVSSLIGNWNYEPIRFWDKTASFYDFYAASPFTPKSTTADGKEDKVWSFDDATKKISLANFTVSGINRVTTATNGVDKLGVLTTVDKAAVMSFEEEDLMISTDIPRFTDYTYSTTAYANGVNLQFNHILSRLNIAIRKKSPDLDNYTVKLNSVKIYNMLKSGSFNEASANSESTPALAEGTIARWTPGTDKFAPGTMVYTPAEALVISSTSAASGASYQYVYEGLVIPQNVGFAKTVLVNDENKPAKHFVIDGSNATAESAPYIVINYEIGTGADDNYKKVDGYEYYFNLADVFGATTDTGIDFCEGWQNTLKITLAPVAIKFDAEVYQWDEKFGESATEDPKTGTTFELK